MDKSTNKNELRIHQRHLLKSKDKKKFIKRLENYIPIEEFNKLGLNILKRPIEWIKLGSNEELYAIDHTLAFWFHEDQLIPLLSFLLEYPIPIKAVKVDTGAIKFVSNGADIMRPGIVDIDENILKGDIIGIKDPTHNRVIAIGKALYDGNTMKKMEKGKVIKNIHTLNDKIWRFSKTFK